MDPLIAVRTAAQGSQCSTTWRICEQRKHQQLPHKTFLGRVPTERNQLVKTASIASQSPIAAFVATPGAHESKCDPRRRRNIRRRESSSSSSSSESTNKQIYQKREILIGRPVHTSSSLRKRNSQNQSARIWYSARYTLPTYLLGEFHQCDLYTYLPTFSLLSNMGNGSGYIYICVYMCISFFSHFSRLMSCIIYTYRLAEFRYMIDSRTSWLDLFVSLFVC